MSTSPQISKSQIKFSLERILSGSVSNKTLGNTPPLAKQSENTLNSAHLPSQGKYPTSQQQESPPSSMHLLNYYSMYQKIIDFSPNHTSTNQVLSVDTDINNCSRKRKISSPNNEEPKKKATKKVSPSINENNSPLKELFMDLEDDDISEYNHNDDIIRIESLATPQAIKKLSKIVNKIGSYTCKLCQTEYADPFELAHHDCPCIERVQYACPDCPKIFSCPANLASHRRWHKPKETINSNPTPNNISPTSPTEPRAICTQCNKTFKRQTYMKKHMASCHERDSVEQVQPQLTKVPIYGCKLCAGSFYTEKDLTIHIFQSHFKANHFQIRPMLNSGFPFSTLAFPMNYPGVTHHLPSFQQLLTTPIKMY